MMERINQLMKEKRIQIAVNWIHLPRKLDDILQRANHSSSQVPVLGLKNNGVVEEKHWEVGDHLTQLSNFDAQ